MPVCSGGGNRKMALRQNSLGGVRRASRTRLRPFAGTILAVLVFAASLIWLAAGVSVGNGGDDTPLFHIDEAHKLGEAFYYHVLFEMKDLNHPAWTEDFYARINPPVGKYIFGAVLSAAGHHVHD
jgi:hypothetical protein